MPFFKDPQSEADKLKPGKKKRKTPSKLSHEEEEVLRELSTKTWPKGSFKYLPSAVRGSMRGYRHFEKVFQEILAESKKKFPDGCRKVGKNLYENDNLHSFIQNKLAHSFLPAGSFVICWFEDIHDRVANGKVKWNGKLRPFSVEDKVFQQDGYDLATEYAGNSGYCLWDQFMTLLRRKMEK